MSGEWVGVTGTVDAIDGLAAERMDSPFNTSEFLGAMASLGNEIWVIRHPEQPGLASGAYVQRGRLGAHLVIPAVAPVRSTSSFWVDVRRLADQIGCTRVSVLSYGSPAELEEPDARLGYGVSWRYEHSLTLGTDQTPAMRNNHRRNVRKAERAGITYVVSRDRGALEEHQRLRLASTARRVARGESGSSTDMPVESALLEYGAGELHQAWLEGRAVSSLFMLRSKRTAYYRSAGTSPAGRTAGASPALIMNASRLLYSQGVTRFYLGGAPKGSSLEHFKSGFGTQVDVLPEVVFPAGSWWRRSAAAGWATLRSASARFGR